MSFPLMLTENYLLYANISPLFQFTFIKLSKKMTKIVHRDVWRTWMIRFSPLALSTQNNLKRANKRLSLSMFHNSFFVTYELRWNITYTYSRTIITCPMVNSRKNGRITFIAVWPTGVYDHPCPIMMVVMSA